MKAEDSGDDAGQDIDSTVVVPRGGSGRRAARPAEADRAAESLDDTVVVSRGPAASTGSPEPGVTASPPADEGDTVVVPGAPRRPAAAPRRAAQRSAGAAVLIPVQLPTGVPESPRASRGQGVGHRERYDPRPVPSPPPAAAPLPTGVDASRLEAPAMPSVRKASRRAGVLTIAALLAAVVLSVAGLVWVVQSLSAG